MDTKTILEKRRKLHDYCVDVGCKKCLLRVGGWEKQVDIIDCLIIEESCESDLDLALGIIESRIDVVNDEADKLTVDNNVEIRRVDDIGRLAIPKVFRDRLNIPVGAELKITLIDDVLIITKPKDKEV